MQSLSTKTFKKKNENLICPVHIYMASEKNSDESCAYIKYPLKRIKRKFVQVD